MLLKFHNQVQKFQIAIDSGKEFHFHTFLRVRGRFFHQLTIFQAILFFWESKKEKQPTSDLKKTIQFYD